MFGFCLLVLRLRNYYETTRNVFVNNSVQICRKRPFVDDTLNEITTDAGTALRSRDVFFWLYYDFNMDRLPGINFQGYIVYKLTVQHTLLLWVMKVGNGQKKDRCRVVPKKDPHFTAKISCPLVLFCT